MHPKYLAIPAVLLLSAACAPRAVSIGAAPASAPAPAEAPRPSPPADTLEEIGEGFALGESRPIVIGPDLLGDRAYDLPMQANEWVRMELEFLVHQRHDVVRGWMERAERYAGFARDVFASYGIPRDLHHLGMIESGYRPTVRSHAGAVGIWQFMPATGRGMGLRIDSLVDERMDPVRSTHAAARHLRQLYRQFGDWSLAAAAYNAGGGRISRGMQRFGARDFWQLAQRGDLAQETRHYVPRLYATTIIAKDPVRFGYAPPSGPARPFAYDSILVDLPTPLPVLAEAGGITLAELVDLNPHLVRQIAPRDYKVWVPAGRGPAMQTSFLESEFRRRGGYGTYRVREGDSLDGLARASGLSVDAIRSMNLSTNLDRLRPGDRLRMYADAARVLEQRPAARTASTASSSSSTRATERSGSSSARASERSASSSSSSSSSASSTSRSTSAAGPRASSSSSASSSAAAGRSHTVGDGETLWGIARRYGVTVDAVKAANGMERETIRPGQTLRIPPDPSAPREHVVEPGETLWGIARRYETTVDALRRANELSGSAQIQPGQTLSIPR